MTGAVFIQEEENCPCLAVGLWWVFRGSDDHVYIVIFFMARKPDSLYWPAAEWAHWTSPCPLQDAVQTELVVTGQSRSHIILSVLADGAAPLCPCGHFCALQRAGER